MAPGTSMPVALGRLDVHEHAGGGVDLDDAEAARASRSGRGPTAITSMPMQVRRKWRATSCARSALSTWTAGVTSMLTPPAERFATLRSQTLAAAGRDALARVALLLDAGDHRLVADDLAHGRGRAVGPRPAWRSRARSAASTVETAVALDPGRPPLAAPPTNRPLTQSRRKSLPARLVSTMMSASAVPPPARAKASASSTGVLHVGGDADALVAAQRLDRHRVADLRRHGQRLRRGRSRRRPAAPGSRAGRGTPCSRPCGW